MNGDITLKGTHHTAECKMFGKGDSLYRVSFEIDDSFTEVKSHAAEIEMLCVLDGCIEGDEPYIAVQCDDEVYGAVGLFEEKGSIDDAIELTPLSGRFLFKAKKEYYSETDRSMMYFYGFIGLADEYDCNGLCLVYPKEYVGTENERFLMKVLDDAAASYKEELISGSPEPREDTALPAPTEKKLTAKKIARGAVKTASVIRKIRIGISIAAILGILIYLLIGKIADSFSKHHFIAVNSNVDIISEFTQEEQNDILEAFDVVIPESESGARLASFMRNNRYGDLTGYVIEIDGVKDYGGFFSANSGRNMGASLNETDPRENKSPEYYYITYNEGPASHIKVPDDVHERIAELFDEMYKK